LFDILHAEQILPGILAAILVCGGCLLVLEQQHMDIGTKCAVSLALHGIYDRLIGFCGNLNAGNVSNSLYIYFPAISITHYSE
jgi:hypothetical protein